MRVRHRPAIVAPSTLAHPVFAALAALAVWRALQQQWVAEVAPPETVATLRLALPLLSAYASALAIAARRFRDDALSVAGLLVVVAILALGQLGRDATGLLFVAAIAIRFAPLALVAVVGGARPAWLVFLTAFGVYGALAAWVTVATAPYGDQVHYLLAADRLAHASVDATLDAELFRSLIGVPPSAEDAATHLVDTALGPRAIQGYAVPALLLPGWLLLGRLGASLVVALFAAWASLQTALLLRETAPARVVGVTWAMTSFLPPLVPLAAYLYPNAIGAAIIVTAYRLAFTRARPQYALAGALLATTLFLTPRDAIALVALAPFVRSRAFFAAVGAVALVAIVANAALYGLPLPYAGYVYGTAAAQSFTGEPSISFRFWVGLPAILFDGTFGVAGSAPWLFLALAGIAAGLRTPKLRPALVAVGASLLALSLFRYWEGGYAPPNRYLVDVLPLVAPLVALGLVRAAGAAPRAAAGLLAALGALAGLVFAAAPDRALNTAFQRQLRDAFEAILGIDPLGWLPSFQPTTPDWYIGAYARLLPALAIAGALVWLGVRMERASREPPAARGPVAAAR